ncbi:MAG: hypothetical protein MJ025_02795, partial [Victivallaceae bacterium]|nr:hypothetical protein [Victivallaceae bacterium]
SLGGARCLTDPDVRNATVQAFCFTLAVAQLTVGHVLAAMHTRSWRSFCGNLGWTLIIWGNFLLAMRLIVWPGSFPVAMYWLYGCGLGLVIVFGVDWHNIADVFQLPFSVIGSFSDLLSYIRLFAVGMAGSCIAQSFNGMAVDVVKSSPWFILAGIVIVLFGHLLNLAMGFLGVMVHGVRLNTLEFSNHVGLTWSGVKYHPFAKDKDGNKEEEQIK